MLPICFSNQHVAKSTHLSTIDTMDLCVYVGAECPIWASTLRTRRWDMVGFAKLLSCLFWNFGCGRNRWWLIAMTRPLWLVSLGICVRSCETSLKLSPASQVIYGQQVIPFRHLRQRLRLLGQTGAHWRDISCPAEPKGGAKEFSKNRRYGRCAWWQARGFGNDLPVFWWLQPVVMEL